MIDPAVAASARGGRILEKLPGIVAICSQGENKSRSDYERSRGPGNDP
jgi:hypothetical protein